MKKLFKIPTRKESIVSHALSYLLQNSTSESIEIFEEVREQFNKEMEKRAELANQTKEAIEAFFTDKRKVIALRKAKS